MYNQLTLHPCAKVNLGLYITGKRPDGYHTLETIFLPVSLYDTLCIRRRSHGIMLSCDNPLIPTDRSNLVFRAAQKFFEAWSPQESPPGVTIHLTKRIPAGGGLGGGSSDAAYTLLGLQKMFGNPLSERTVGRLAVQLGADVPFFLKSRVCLGKGIGEKLTPVDVFYPGWIVLVYPGFSISTKDVFGRYKFDLTNSNKNVSFLGRKKINILFSVIRSIRNDLERVVFPLYPDLAHLKESLDHEGAEYSSLSGSGSTVFGLFADKDRAEHAVHQLSPKNHVFITRQHQPPA